MNTNHKQDNAPCVSNNATAATDVLRYVLDLVRDNSDSFTDEDKYIVRDALRLCAHLVFFEPKYQNPTHFRLTNESRGSATQLALWADSVRAAMAGRITECLRTIDHPLFEFTKAADYRYDLSKVGEFWELEGLRRSIGAQGCSEWSPEEVQIIKELIDTTFQRCPVWEAYHMFAGLISHLVFRYIELKLSEDRHESSRGGVDY